MTTGWYDMRQSALGSQVVVQALYWSASPNAGNNNNAWNVNFNNGNTNNNNKNNNNYVRAVRAGECQPCGVVFHLRGHDAASVMSDLIGHPSGVGTSMDSHLREDKLHEHDKKSMDSHFRGNDEKSCHGVQMKALYAAWRMARRKKRPSVNQLHFEHNWLQNLFILQQQLDAGTWQPKPYVSFVATHPKPRQIHAPDFSDRVVHHWLVPQLEAVFEPKFIFDSYANRRGKGTHQAVKRTQTMLRQVQSGQGGGYYLQLDIYNFFNSIHRATLYSFIKPHIQHLPLAAQQVVHALLRRSPLDYGVHYRASSEEYAKVPPHKRLECAAKGCGIPIGNLSSQFFANVYLNPLDQFIKHTLKAKRYVRYVDDFVLVHQDKKVLEVWHQQIERFLVDHLRLCLKQPILLKPLSAGLDFLGYWLYPTHTLVRPRVLGNLRHKLNQYCHADDQTQQPIRYQFIGTPVQLAQLRSIWASYQGHCQHANHHKLYARLYREYPWLPYLATKRHFPYTHQQRRFSVFLAQSPFLSLDFPLRGNAKAQHDF